MLTPKETTSQTKIPLMFIATFSRSKPIFLGNYIQTLVLPLNFITLNIMEVEFALSDMLYNKSFLILLL